MALTMYCQTVLIDAAAAFCMPGYQSSCWGYDLSATITLTLPENFTRPFGYIFYSQPPELFPGQVNKPSYNAATTFCMSGR